MLPCLERAGRQHPDAPPESAAARQYLDWLLHRVSPSAPDYADWSDAVLDLFSRRVIGLGVRPDHVVEWSTVQREQRRSRQRQRSRHASRQAARPTVARSRV